MAKSKVRVAAALTEYNSQRNGSLHAAAKVLKASPLAKNKTVELKWKERAVEVDGNVAFQQGKQELGGSFTGAFSGLTLP